MSDDSFFVKPNDFFVRQKFLGTEQFSGVLKNIFPASKDSCIVLKDFRGEENFSGTSGIFMESSRMLA